MDENYHNLEEITYMMYQALDTLLGESRTTSSHLKRPAEEAMKAYDEWDRARWADRQPRARRVEDA